MGCASVTPRRLGQLGSLLLAAFWLYCAARGHGYLLASLHELVRLVGDAPRLSLALGVGAVLLALVAPLRRWAVRVPAPLFVLAIATAAAWLAARAQIRTLQGLPQIPDEFGYLLQIRTFAHGAIAAPLPKVADFFYASWSMHHRGHWIAVFPPGFALAATPFALLGHLSLANPVIGAAAVVVLYLLARDLFGEGVGRLAAVLWIASTFRQINDASWMSHPTAELAGLVAFLAAWRALRPGGKEGKRRAWLWALIWGAAQAWLLATRPLNTLALALGLMPLVLLRLVQRPRPTLARVGIALLGALPLVVLFGLYNRALTGSALRAPQTAYFAQNEEIQDCFQLGFGPHVGDCPVTQGQFFDDGYSVKDAIVNSRHRLWAWSWNVFGASALLAIALLPLLVAGIGGWPGSGRLALVAGVATSQILAYGLFFYHGVTAEYGARFFYEITPLVVLLYAVAAVAAFRAPSAIGERLGHFLRRRLPGRPGRAVALTLLLELLVALPVGLLAAAHVASGRGLAQRFYSAAHERPNSLDGAAARALAAAGHPRHVLVLSTACCMTPLYLDDPVHLDRNDVLFVKDFGPRANARVLRAFPDRRAFLLMGERLVPVPAAWRSLPETYLELEDFDLSMRVDAWAHHVPFSRASDGAALALHVTRPGGYVEVAVPVPATARYWVSLGVVHSPDFGWVRATLDGVAIGEPVDGCGRLRTVETQTTLEPLLLRRGERRLRLTVLRAGREADSLRGAFDDLELTPVPRALGQSRGGAG